jgi:hypothetical protein
MQSQPVLFMGFVLASSLIGSLDKLVVSLSTATNDVTKMLHTILDKITTYILIFALLFKKAEATPSQDMGTPSMIWVSLFILDFVSTWFN